MSNDSVILTSVNLEQFDQGIAEMRQAIDNIRRSAIMKIVDEPSDDMPEDSSYGTILERASRYLTEVLSTCFVLGIDFCIQGNDNHEGYVHWTEHSHTDDAVTQYVQMQDALTPAAIAASTADALAEVITRVINGSRPYASNYTHDIVIEDGKFINADDDSVFAFDAHAAVIILERRPHTKIKIVSSYD